MRTAVSRQTSEELAIQSDVYNLENDQNLSANRAFGRLALRFYNQGYPHQDYESIIGELRFDMIKRGMKIKDLGLDNDESKRLRDLTGLD